MGGRSRLDPSVQLQDRSRWRIAAPSCFNKAYQQRINHAPTINAWLGFGCDVRLSVAQQPCTFELNDNQIDPTAGSQTLDEYGHRTVNRYGQRIVNEY